ncbi:MAG: hypothetical protein MUF00_20960, partial [Gemmatimonadaceae bacterium]|nr:hypothetical protein [Gemmatimonadaceae bacterium]
MRQSRQEQLRGTPVGMNVNDVKGRPMQTEVRLVGIEVMSARRRAHEHRRLHAVAADAIRRGPMAWPAEPSLAPAAVRVYEDEHGDSFLVEAHDGGVTLVPFVVGDPVGGGRTPEAGGYVSALSVERAPLPPLRRFDASRVHPTIAS